MITAGYSGTPLAKKLGIGPTSNVCLTRPIEGFETEIAPYLSTEPPYDVAVAFCKTLPELEQAFLQRFNLQPAGGLWICWPKKKSGIQTDITEDVLREVGLPLGIVDNKVCAIDEQWSGLRFVWRKELRANLPKP